MLTEEKRQAFMEKLVTLSDEQISAVENYVSALVGAEIAADTNEQYLTFLCGGQMFGIHISQVRQILQVPPITPLPRICLLHRRRYYESG